MSSSINNGKTAGVSWGTLIKIGLALAIGYAVYLARDALLLVLSGFIISALFNPAVDSLVRAKFSRAWAVFLVYFSIFGLLGLAIYLVAPLFIVETQQLGQLFPMYFAKLAPFLAGLGFPIFESMDAFAAAIRDWLVGASSSVVGSVAAIFGGFLAMFIVLTAAVFSSMEEPRMKRFVTMLVSKENEKNALAWWQRAQMKISGWFAVRLAGMAAVGFFTWLACWALGVRYPIFLGFFAGIADIVPFIGPFAAGALIVLIALLDSWQKALLVLIIFTAIQQLENNLVMPLLAQKFIAFPAILVLTSLLVGEALFGLAGAILAIPLFGLCYDFARECLVNHKKNYVCGGS